jgi:hypothetical protein
MLREIPNLRQGNPELTRRWFQSDYFDLFTWQDAAGAFVRFQLCYDVERRERAFEWNAQRGFFHDGVEYEDRASARPAASILKHDGKLDSGTVLPRFVAEAANLPQAVRELIDAKIRAYLVQRHDERAARKRVRREDWQQRG